MSHKSLREIIASAVCILLVGFPGILLAQVQTPDTPAATKFNQMFECLNQPDSAQRQKFIEGAFSDDFEYSAAQRMKAINDVRSEFGQTTLVDVFKSSEFEIACLLRSKQNNEHLRVVLEVEQEEPHKITSIEFEPTKVSSPGNFRDVQDLPSGKIGDRIMSAIDAINANDDSKTSEFIHSHTTTTFRKREPIAKHVTAFKETYKLSGGVQFIGIRKYSKNSADRHVVILKKKLGGWYAMVMTIEPESPNEISSIQFSPARAPATKAEKNSVKESTSSLSKSAAITELKNFIAQKAKSGEYSGAFLLASGDKIEFQTAHGLASRRYVVPNNIETKFNLGSMNKMFTSVAIMQLVQGGKVSLDDTLDQYVGAQWLAKDIAAKIKIKHLLTHTSGLGSYFNAAFSESSRETFRELADYKPLIKSEQLAFEPGTKWKYSNTGMLLLGVVIEKASQENYFAYIRENVYKPAGMANSDSYDMDMPVPNLAIGYVKMNGKWTNNLYKHVIRGGPAGGGFSTVGDLFRFSNALRANQLLDKKHTQMLIAAKPELNSPKYGFGFQIWGKPENRVVGHSGGFPGIDSGLKICLDSGYTIASLSNQGRGSQLVMNKATELLNRIDPSTK